MPLDVKATLCCRGLDLVEGRLHGVLGDVRRFRKLTHARWLFCDEEQALNNGDEILRAFWRTGREHFREFEDGGTRGLSS